MVAGVVAGAVHDSGLVGRASGSLAGLALELVAAGALETALSFVDAGHCHRSQMLYSVDSGSRDHQYSHSFRSPDRMAKLAEGAGMTECRC